jgi:TnpA family transposase
MKTNIVAACPGQKVRLSEIDADETAGMSKQEAIQQIGQLREKVSELQQILYAEHRQSLLIVFQAMDTGGTDGTIRKLLSGINPAGIWREESDFSWLVAWHIRDETYRKALAELVNYQHRIPFAAYWGEGTTSSSDGQRYRAGGRGEAAAEINARYGSDPSVTFYTHISDQYAPFHTKVINVTVRDATHVLDGLLYHESDLRIEEHYTDTSGFTDHVFALCHFLGFRFAPRIRDLADKRLYVPGKPGQWPVLSPLIGGSLNLRLIEQQFPELVRLAASIKQGTVTASLILRKLGSYPRQNSLALALRELGRIERTLFTLHWLQDPALRRRVQIGLNKGEARNALARAVFFYRLGEIRDRSFENQRYRASGLNLVIAAISLWNTVYLERAILALRQQQPVDDALLKHLSPLGWEHINLTGDYVWHANKRVAAGRFRPLRFPKRQKVPS